VFKALSHFFERAGFADLGRAEQSGNRFPQRATE
jgi:hypothetical protein